MFNLNEKLGEYICVHCKNDFWKIPLFKPNECYTAYEHFIVKKPQLKKINVKRTYQT